MNNDTNPMFAKFDQALGVTTPTSSGGPVSSRAAEIRALANPSATSADTSPGYMQSVADTMKQGANDSAGALTSAGTDVVKNWQDYNTKNQGADPITKVLNAAVFAGHTAGDIAKGTIGMAGGTIKAAAAPLTQARSTTTGQTFGDAANKGVVQPVQDAASALSAAHPEVVKWLADHAAAHPDIAKSVGDIVNTLGLVGGGKVLGGEVTPVSDAISATKNAVSDTVQGAKDTMQSTVDAAKSAIKPAQGASDLEKNIAEAQLIKNPTGKYTPTEVQALRDTGEVKTTGSGIFKKEVAAPKPTLEDETLAQLVQDGKISSKNFPVENMAAIKQEAHIHDANIDELVNRPALNKPFNTSILNKVFDSTLAGAKRDRVFLSDSSEQKAYTDVIDVAKEELAKNPYNMGGLRQSIKAFNGRMQDILGKDIYSDSAGSPTSIGKARLQAAKDVRTNLNNFLADNLESIQKGQDKTLYTEKGISNTLPSKSQYAPKSNVQAGGLYKDQLRKEAQLLNSADEIGYRSRGMLNKSNLKLWLEKNPHAAHILELGLGVTGAELLYKHL